MDENRFEITPSEISIETIEGILAPSIVFNDYNPHSANIILSNEGFYSDEYQISYFFASTFIESLSGPNTINVEPGNSENIEVSLIPLPKIPREGGSQLQIKISNQYETKSVTYVLSYDETKIEITEQTCNKHSILFGQDIICTSTISNQGYNSNQLSINIIVSNENGITEIIDQINIEELKNEESLVIRTTYFPKVEENFKLYVDVNGDGVLLISGEMQDNVNVVAAGNEEMAEIATFEAPNIKLTQTFFAISFAGIAFQFRRSENFRYLTFKFFIPMYSRLQKDTLADEPTRQKLLSTIYAEPGANFTQLKERLGLHNGTLAHHINILENNKMVTSHRSGRQRLFFPFGRSINSTIRNSLITNRTQKDIIQIVKENPGITQSMISQQLDTSRQKINYHVNSLSNNSLLRVEKQGRITRIYPTYFT
jgi:DNA-binding MarR family transcriptional regulator